ncbi:IS66 family transposase [Schleiferilactobacillus shenzhenensis]|uniref:Transposase IS66 central domain-containing protein n=1 Tax=Schleiferilactobacillus shenzhenensis LY-73 TaxID=1231336 RepID=U4TSL6_9LACO|nr:hypothetical protein L248_0462 [Schleiferilactobacillus shenzhenensis LY-73]
MKDLGVLAKAKLDWAVECAEHQQSGLAHVLINGWLEISNNQAEQVIK